MPNEWSRRTRVKVAVVAALLGLLVWADARSQQADEQHCTSNATSTAVPCADR